MWREEVEYTGRRKKRGKTRLVTGSVNNSKGLRACVFAVGSGGMRAKIVRGSKKPNSPPVSVRENLFSLYSKTVCKSSLAEVRL